MRDITLLSGGMGGARFLRGLLAGIASSTIPGLAPDARVTVVANTADDLWWHGLKVSPDLDAVMHLGDPAGAGGRDETAPHDRTGSVLAELRAYGVEPTWLEVADHEVATHLVRTQMLEAGYPLSQVTEALCRRWNPGVTLLPVTDDRVETHLAVPDPDSPSGRRVVRVQEYVTRLLRDDVPVESVHVIGLDKSSPAPGVLEAVTSADLVLVGPLDPVLHVGPLVGVPGVREALRTTSAKVIGISPVVAGATLGNPALPGQVVPGLGVELSADAVARHLGSRRSGGLLDGWVVDPADASVVSALQVFGLDVATADLATESDEAIASLVAAAVDLVQKRPA